MNKNSISEYIKVLENFSSVCDFVLIGSMGLKLAYPDIMNFEPHDMDIVISDKSNLWSAVKFFIDNRYKVYSWNEIIDENFDYDCMNGRIYFRAVKDSYQIDVNYSLENIAYSEITENIQIINNIKVPTKELFIKLLSAVDTPKNSAIIERLKNI